MSLFRRVVVISLAAGLACLLSVCESGSPAAPADPVPTELEGSWSGMNKDGIDPTFWTYTMTLDSIVIDGDGTIRCRGSFILDSTVVPKTITITIGEAADPAHTGKTIPALYHLSGNILEITANAPGSPRPASLSAAPVISLINNN
ncbi:MAG: hypothetical protein JXA18_00930 [Chitinispirillaceae bacterium]|nr:hypothetical protein [Chitinispirillaceae bacterium]